MFKKLNENSWIYNTDSYKFSHYLQYPPDTKHLSFYIEARKNPWNTPLIFFGLQMILMRDFGTPITMDDIDEAEPLIRAHGEPFNRAGFERIVKEWGGYPPVTIQAIPEGTKCRAGDIQIQFTNNDPELPWLPGFMATALDRVWAPSTVASLSNYAKSIIQEGLEKSADNLSNLPFKLHDFGARGTTCKEQAGIVGPGHLLNFMGTDTVQALIYARNYYGADVAGFSVPAAEHSTITAWGKMSESAAYKNMIDKFGGEGKIFAVVSDSYDIMNACENIWGEELKDRVISNGGCLVVRPDSGNPVTVPEQVISTLAHKFGFTSNTKMYRMLPPYLRCIQGDGVNPDSIRAGRDNLISFGWSSDNLTWGMGAELLQKINRDTLSYADKASAIHFGDDQVWIGISKDPVGDHAKKSKAGRFTHPLLEDVWTNGKLLRYQEWDNIKNRVNNGMMMAD